MSSDPVVNLGALEPLFGPSDVPNQHRVRGEHDGDPARIINGRRPSPVVIAQNMRRDLADWREAQYGGASDTSRELLHHWFYSDHYVESPDGASFPFNYYFCQREAIESLIYLYEVRGIRTLSGLTAEFGGPDRERAALGINPEEDAWAKYAFKVATGAGKTKIMSLAIVWSYFHSLREPDSELAKNFVVIAPGVTVFERLKEDFGDGRIFHSDPLIPSAWRGDWNLSVVLQDEAAGTATGGVLYLTNIHRLYNTTKRRKKDAETYDWMGPNVSKAKALDTSRALRERITSHPRLMVLNDEAHHVWDSDSAWNEAIGFLHSTTRKRGGGLVAQLDLSATPKDNKGNVFRHVVVDTPLGEAVDAGIIKTPVIGHGSQLVERAHDDAAYKYEQHLTIGYNRWLASKDEWDQSGKKPLMFVMTEDTEAADQIARRLNADPAFAELNGKTINLHTNLKGKLKKRGSGVNAYYEFVESEKDISDEDLKALRKLSRDLDENSSPYRCIVSVLMLREGWDVRNVTTIVPLRPLTAASKILPEQTLGRGLRRMTPPGQAAEVVTVVEHPSFVGLYREQLSEEGVPIDGIDIDKIPRTTVTIYPDAENKDLDALNLELPRLSPGYRIEPELGDISIADVRSSFGEFATLPLGAHEDREIQYEGRHLITNEIVEQMTIKLDLLADGVGAISFFREEIERAVKIRGTHAKLAPLIQEFLEQVLFEEPVTLYESRLLARLADSDVREHIRATFVPLVLSRITRKEKRLKEAAPQSMTTWKPFQATHSERHPAEIASRTPFNLVPCNRELEVAFSEFADRADDVAAFAKNAGPQALRIDYLARDGRRSIYTADFIVRLTDGHYLLVETKGQVDVEVAARARAGIEWCKAATTKKTRWEYLYVPQDVFQRISRRSMRELARACQPALADLLRESGPQLSLRFDLSDHDRIAEQVEHFISAAELKTLPVRFQKAIEHAVTLYYFHENKEDVSYGPIFQPLLGPVDNAAEALLLERLSQDVPVVEAEQKDYFEPDMGEPANRKERDTAEYLRKRAEPFKRLLVHRSPLMPTGLLVFCLEYAGKDSQPLGGIFTSIYSHFGELAKTDLGSLLKQVYEFRNDYIAHEKKSLDDSEQAKEAVRLWVRTLSKLHQSRRKD
ncbi:MAG: restriction endonuclease subunit R [Planctomycetaceae bacterium]|nr:restriction endonuclease subunit R [Planctomycetaceae bacterium]